MKRMTDERLETMLSNLCEAQPEASFVYRKKEEKAAVIPFNRSRGIAAVAALVLVSVLSVSLYFLLDRKPPLIAAPPRATDSTDAITPEDGSTIPPLPSSAKADETQAGRSDTTAPPLATDAPGQIIPQSTAPSATTGTAQPTVAPTQGATTTPDMPIRPTEHIITPSEPIMPPWDDPPDPTDPPTDEPVEEPTHAAPQPVEPTDAAGEPELPPPTEAGSYAATFRASYRTAEKSAVVYCKVYDSSGRMLGDGDLYAGSHRASVDSFNGVTEKVSYTVPEGLIVYPGKYNYIFYDANGKMLAQGQTYVW